MPKIDYVTVQLRLWVDATDERVLGRAGRFGDTVYATADFPEELARKIPADVDLP